MKSSEICKKLSQLEKEKVRLEAELEKAIEAEETERKQNLFDNSKAFIVKLWELYFQNEDNTEAQKRLDMQKTQNSLDIWIESDVACALKRTKLEALEGIKNFISLYKVNCDIDKCIEDAKVRLDFASYLRGVKNGSDLSHKVGYSFDSDDLMELMKLHKSNKFRKKIEDLLTDCNFHSGCELLCKKEYDQYEKYVMET